MPQHYSDPTRASEATALPILRCKVCGEETTHDRESSFYGHVHRWGPTTHKFKPATEADALADARRNNEE